jgi:hypothetical protein
VGNSLGGLYCRYAAALTYTPHDRRVAGLLPATFLTTATPHLGVGAFGYLGLVPSWLQAAVGGSGALGRTIAELLLQDGNGNGGAAPLLVRMASPRSPASASATSSAAAQLPFLEALGAFGRRVAYANAENDFLVAYETAAIVAHSQHSQSQHARASAAARGAAAAAESGGGGGGERVLYTVAREATPFSDDAAAAAEPLSAPPPPRDALALQRRMASGLGSLSWTETAVRFPGLLPIAHNKIVALRRDPVMTWLYADGAAVVAHTAAALLEDLATGEGGGGDDVADDDVARRV